MKFSLQASASRIFLWQRANHTIYLARNILLALYITPAEFGDFAIALNLATYIAIFGTLEFRTAFFTTKELTPEQLRAQWSAEVALNVFTLILGLLLSPWLATTRASGIVTAMLCLLVVNLIEASFSTHLYLLEKDLRFPFITALYTVVNLVSFLACLALAIMGWGLGALVADRLIAAGVKWLVLGRKSGWRPRFQIELRSLLHYWSSIRVLFFERPPWKGPFRVRHLCHWEMDRVRSQRNLHHGHEMGDAPHGTGGRLSGHHGLVPVLPPVA